MSRYGYIKVAAASFDVSVADVGSNVNQIKALIQQAKNDQVDLVVFPELSLSGYTCGDLFLKEYLIKQCMDGLNQITEDVDETINVVVGLPLVWHNQLYNCAVVINGHTIKGIVPKSYIPNYNEFYESRWFASGKHIHGQTMDIHGQTIPFGTDLLFRCDELIYGIEICEDLWVSCPMGHYACANGALVMVNPSASNEAVAKMEYRKNLISMTSARQYCGYVYTSSGDGESSSDLVFSSAGMIAQCGSTIAYTDENHGLLTGLIDLQKIKHDRLVYHSQYRDNEFMDYRSIQCGHLAVDVQLQPHFVDPYPFVPDDLNQRQSRCKEIMSMQSRGLATRLRHIHCKKAVIGISGGLDSTLALLVTLDAFDRLGYDHKDILAITMPGFGTTERTRNNAMDLMALSGVTIQTVDITAACVQHFKDIDHDPMIFDVTYENTQARERTQILMDIANKCGGIVIGTGDLSELALGWCTYNGDHMSMYGVNGSIPKTLVRYLVEAYGQIHPEYETVLKDIVDTPISPELLPGKDGQITQKTEDTIGKYDLQDFFLYHYLRNGYDHLKIRMLARIAFPSIDGSTIDDTLDIFYKRFYSQQFKRNCLPDGVKVGSVCLSPRGDWRMPSDISSALEYDDSNQ